MYTYMINKSVSDLLFIICYNIVCNIIPGAAKKLIPSFKLQKLVKYEDSQTKLAKSVHI